MKVNRGKFNSVYKPPISDNNIKKTSTNKASEDKIVISEEAKKFSVQKSYVNIAVNDITSTTSTAKLQSLKNQITTGIYNVSSDRIADAILENIK